MKYIILISFIIVTSCCTNKNDDDIANDTNDYLIQIEQFDTNIQSTLENHLDDKTFFIRNKEIKESTSKNEGNTFYINEPINDFKKIIKVKNISKSSSELRVHIAFYKNENQQLNQYFNPGDFDLSKLHKRDKVKALEELIVMLTFK